MRLKPFINYVQVSYIKSLWVKQRAEIVWLSKGNDDLKGCYNSIEEMKNVSCIKELTSPDGVPVLVMRLLGKLLVF
ncbi:hypothetical protein KFK09_008461 [Dendrobium nobile]|uniref:Uncharacterized protein n=1 Tax=Dendrobium nobile TaxID=94219 RepID=A0A8T3BK63_DENNO|nr:hypothetical protein KFK09_008461 [Dendrobium nobile]